jgi:hypothetical protein
MEAAPPGIKRIVVFDFDDTLVYTPTPEEGAPKYQQATGKPWYIKDPQTAQAHGFHPSFRREGWWGNPKTLEAPIFEPHPEKLNQDVARAFQSFKDDPQTYTVVMTGRIAKMADRVKEILAHYNIHADEYFFKGQKDVTQDKTYPRAGDTFDFKAFVIVNRLMGPEIQTVEIFDDREEHIPRFVQLGKDLKVKWPNVKSVIIHDVRQNKNYPI